MRLSVVDENVLCGANGIADHATPRCEEACITFLGECIKALSLVLDVEGEILVTYAQHCSYSGEPGAGDAFFIWANDHAAALTRFTLPRDHSGQYIGFPTDEALATFDSDDRKWVALALAAGPEAEIVNALDSDYRDHAEALGAAGVRVRELCPECLKPAATKDRRKRRAR